MTTLKNIIQAVEENNTINGGSWGDWESLEHIEGVYGDYDDADVPRHRARLIIDAAIWSSGTSLGIDLPLIEQEIWGQNFSGSFYDQAK